MPKSPTRAAVRNTEYWHCAVTPGNYGALSTNGTPHWHWEFTTSIAFQSEEATAPQVYPRSPPPVPLPPTQAKNHTIRKEGDNQITGEVPGRREYVKIINVKTTTPGTIYSNTGTASLKNY